MMRFVLRRLLFQNLLKITVCALVSATVVVPLAWGQHGGGASHAGGGAHAGGGPLGGFHGAAPRPSALPAWHPRTPASPPLLGAGTGAFRFRRRPIHIVPPRPIHIVPPRPIFFGLPFYGFGFYSFWWSSCSPLWGWGFDCYNPPPLYGYGFGGYTPPPVYSIPLYASDGGERRDLPQLYLKDGTVYNVTDYWLVDGRIHFTILEEGGTKSVEHVVSFDELDLQRTIDVNTQRGFRFVLRNEPLEQYLWDHPGSTPPPAAPRPRE